jgi:4-amino-4-deoxy-L-arabinose transferase-like glycosyltransferase
MSPIAHTRAATPPVERAIVQPARVGGHGSRLAIAFGLLLAVALLLRLGFIAVTADYVPAHDDRRYARLACSIAVAGQYSLRTPDTTRAGCGAMPRGANEPTAFRPPGYSFFLAGVLAAGPLIPGDFWTDGRVVNAVLGTLVVALVGVIALQVWGRRIAIAAVALAAVDMPLILVGGSLLSETLFVTLVLAAVAVALRSRTARRRTRWAAAAGVLVGLAALTRPTGLVLLVPLGMAAATRPRRPSAAIALVVAAVVTIAPWTIRNAVQMRAFIPVADQLGSWLAGTYNEQARRDPVHPAASQVRVREFRPLDRLDEAPRQRELTRRALAYAADHPDYVPEVLLHNTLRMLNLEGAGWWRAQGESIGMPRWAADAGAYVFWALALLALLGALTAGARRAPPWLWLVPLLLFGAVIVAGSEIRYRAPVEPFIVLLAALAIHSPRERA